MTPEAQRIAIAEACGWTPSTFGKCDLMGNPFPEWDTTPDYLNDLNAMHEAEKVLGRNRGSYGHWLGSIMAKADKNDEGYDIWHATAAQRAEALLRTIGTWQ